MKRKNYLPLLGIIAIVCIPLCAITIEASVSSRSAQSVKMSRVENKMSALITLMESLGDELKALNNKIDNLLTCNAIGAFYMPENAEADSNGCKVIEVATPEAPCGPKEYKWSHWHRCYVTTTKTESGQIFSWQGNLPGNGHGTSREVTVDFQAQCVDGDWHVIKQYCVRLDGGGDAV